MSEKLLQEIEHELDAAKNFTSMSIACALNGHYNMATYFLKVAREDQEHAGRYAQLYEQVTNSVPSVSGLEYSGMTFVLNVLEKYIQMEKGGVKRISDIQSEISQKEHPGVFAELDNFAIEHTQEAYKAKKMRDFVEKLAGSGGNIINVEKFFHKILENEQVPNIFDYK